MEQYTVWYEIKISHDYYPDNSLPLSLFPTQETNAELRNNKILFKNTGAGQWVLLRPKGEQPQLKETDLSFDVRITDTHFYYVTGREVVSNEDARFSISAPLHPMQWQILKIHLPEKAGNESPVSIHWQIPTVEMFFEFICIPKYHSIDMNLKMEESKNVFLIEKTGKVTLADEGETIRFRSQKPIPLRKTYKHKIRLWEVRDSGVRLISDNIPCPDPSERSVFSPNDTITTYYYF